MFQRLSHNLLHPRPPWNDTTNYRRDVLLLADPPVFGGHLHELLAIRIVDVADCREVGAYEWFQVRQISSIDIDAIETNAHETGRYECRAKEKHSG